MENEMNIMNLSIGAIMSLGFVACAADTDSTDDLLNETSQEIFQTGCATLAADATIDAEATPRWSHNGPSMVRNGCIGARIVDVNNYQEGADVRVSGATVGWGDV